jgi:hypothetical protein
MVRIEGAFGLARGELELLGKRAGHGEKRGGEQALAQKGTAGGGDERGHGNGAIQRLNDTLIVAVARLICDEGGVGGMERRNDEGAGAVTAFLRFCCHLHHYLKYRVEPLARVA